MIFVDRGSIPVPDIYQSGQTIREREQIAAEIREVVEGRSGNLIGKANEYALAGRVKGRDALSGNYATTIIRSVRPALVKLFHGKCAYCETPFESDRGDVELFRPRAGARALDGTVDPLHYYWLAIEWENAIIACAHCNRSKGSRFPVQGKRVDLGETSPVKLKAELPYLLDPCSDTPAGHFLPTETGEMVPVTECGEITIEVLNLNREFLVGSRRAAWQEMQAYVRSGIRGEARVPDSLPRELEQLLSPVHPYLLTRSVAATVLLERELPDALEQPAIRELLRHAIPPELAKDSAAPEQVAGPAPVETGRSTGEHPVATAPAPVTLPRTPAPGPPPEKESWFDFGWLFGSGRTKKKETAPSDEKPTGTAPGTPPPKTEGPEEPGVTLAGKKQSYSIEDEDQRTRIAYFTSAKRIERFSISNFKAIENLELELPPPETDRESWLMLLGENGCGKSSILQALALTLMGEEHANSLGLDARRFVRRDSDVSSGEVVVQLSGVGPIRLVFTKESPRFRVEPEDPKVLLLGYGATRLLPRMVGRESSQRRAIRILNLFDPTAPLADTESWLLDRSRVNDEQFESFREDIARLLILPPDTGMYRENGQIEMDYFGTRKALRDMSDGFQSIVALAGDISIGVRDWWGGLRDAEGIVLLDEIEVHLHPTWKISIVDGLRQTCPHLSFIVTTHDPLCLKGLRSEEIIVLRKSPEREVEAIRDIPRIDHLRSDQLLASFLFNLPSTRGSGTSVAIARYSQLLGLSTRTAAEESELNELKGRLSQELSSALTPMQQRVERALRESLSPESIAEMGTAVEMEVLRQVQDLLAPEELP